MQQIVINHIPFSILSYLSQACYLATTLYIIVAFHYFNDGKKAAGLYAFFALVMISVLVFSFLTIKPEHVIFLSVLSILFLIVGIYCAITSLTSQLGGIYSLFFFAGVFSQLVTIAGPLLIINGLNVEPGTYFKYVGFISVLPHLVVFLVLQRIAFKLEETRMLSLNNIL